MTRRFCYPSAIAAGILATSAPGAAADGRDAPGSFITATVDAADGQPHAARLEPGKRARITVSVRDPASGFALAGIGVATWIVPDDGTSCQDWYARIGRASQVPEGVIPLLGFDIVQITRDDHLVLIDPLLDLASANLKAISPVSGGIRALEPATDGQSILLASGDGLSLRLGDPAARSLAEVRLPGAAYSLKAVPGGFWSGLDDGRALFVDARAKPRDPVSVGEGPVRILADDAGTLIALAQDGHARSLAPGAQAFALPGAVRAGAIAPLANSLFALSTSGAELFSADLDAPLAQSRYALAFAADRMEASPTGRWLALADREGEHIAVFDTEAMRVRWTIAMHDPVIEMKFSDNFLYFMHRRQGGVTRVTFDPQASAPGLAAIAAGLASQTLQEAGALPHLVRIRGGGILVASSREKQAYIVSESGAQAAMTMIPLRAGETAGIAVRQRGMTPAAQRGTYVAGFTAPGAGHYRAIVRTDSPELLQCQNFAVGQPGKRPAVRLAAVTPATLQARRDGTIIDFSLSGNVVASRAMLMRADGTWRQFLLPVPERAQGHLALPDPLPAAGRYRLFVETTAPDGTVDTLSQELDL